MVTEHSVHIQRNALTPFLLLLDLRKEGRKEGRKHSSETNRHLQAKIPPNKSSLLLGILRVISSFEESIRGLSNQFGHTKLVDMVTF